MADPILNAVKTIKDLRAQLQQQRERVEKAKDELKACKSEFEAIMEELPQTKTVLSYRIASIEVTIAELEAEGE